MGLRVTNPNAVTIRLEKIADRSTRQLRRVHQQAAEEIAATAAEMAPYKTGELESSVEVWRSPDGRRVGYEVKASAPHAVYMHEGVYDLGKGSIAKQEETQHMVGRKFLERAVDYVMEARGFMARAARAVREGLK